MIGMMTKEDNSEMWKKFSSWVHAICVVTFDLEVGQAMELIYPAHQELSEKDRINICYLAFPDSNSGLMGDVQFHFRIRMSSPTSLYDVPTAHNNYNKLCPVFCQTDTGYMYGYVYFRQVKDKTLKRGYFQKSVVLLSKLPLVLFFKNLMSLVAPEYFENGEPILEAACHDMDQWSCPSPGENLVLPILGTLFQIRIPSKQDNPAASLIQPIIKETEVPNRTHVVPYPHDIQAFPVLYPVLPYLNLLWELVLISEPLVVMATNPTSAANMVQTLISLITPLKFSCDFRPFFTIHDSEFKEYTSKLTAPPSVIIGVTNPFFAKTLKHWPHIVRIAEDSGSKTRLNKSKTKVFEHKPGVYTSFKPYLQSDKSLVKFLLKGIEGGRPVEVQSALLRRHLLELTQSFMIPLERYVASLMPLQKNISPYKSAPKLRPFDPDEFIATVESCGPQLTTGIKGNWVGLYRRFFRTANFSSWFNNRYEEVSKKLTLLHLQSLNDVDLAAWMESRCEVEVVDMVLRFRTNLNAAKDVAAPGATVDKLKEQLQQLFDALPTDLRSVMISS